MSKLQSIKSRLSALVPAVAVSIASLPAVPAGVAAPSLLVGLVASQSAHAEAGARVCGAGLRSGHHVETYLAKFPAIGTATTSHSQCDDVISAAKGKLAPGVTVFRLDTCEKVNQFLFNGDWKRHDACDSLKKNSNPFGSTKIDKIASDYYY